MSDLQNQPKRASFEGWSQVPSVLDRLIAFIFDVLILSPIIGFLLFWIVRDIRTFTYLERDLLEIQLLWAFLFVSYMILSVLILGVLIYYFQSSPGQMFMKLRVINDSHPDRKLTLSQCFLRSFFYFLNFLFFGVPFLEIFTNDRRRLIHERISDTRVITLKQGVNESPLPLEKKFFQLWFKYLISMGMVLLVILFTSAYRSLLRGDFRDVVTSASTEECLMNVYSDEYSEIDASLVYFLMGDESRSCLQGKIENILWKKKGLSLDSDLPQIQLAYLAQGFLARDTGDEEPYFKKVCDKVESNKELCDVVKDQKSKFKDTVLPKQKLVDLQDQRKYLISIFTDLKQSLEINDKIMAVKLLREFKKKGIQSPFLSTHYLKLAWELNQEIQDVKLNRKTKKVLRIPASELVPPDETTEKQLKLKKQIVLDFMKEKGIE